MYLDVADLKTFYDLPIGRLLRVLIGARIHAIWPTLSGQSLLGIGYTGPFMRPYLGSAERCIAAMPAQQGAVCWPRETDNAATLVSDQELPFPDSYFERAILVHSLDHTADPAAILRQTWRVLAPGGRIIVIVPNRRGLWAQAEVSPFGYGRPYSGRQMRELLRNCQFDFIHQEQALFLPPSRTKFILRSARTWERVGSRLWPTFGGVLIIEAEKRIYRGLPAETQRRALHVLRPLFVPEGAAAGLKPVRQQTTLSKSIKKQER